MPHCGTSTFDNHLDCCLIVLIDIQHSTGTRMRRIWWNVINVCWDDVGVLDWDVIMHVWLHSWVHMFGSVLKEILQVPDPAEWDREYRPCVNLHREKWFQLLWKCVKLKSVPCTSNFLAQTWDFRKAQNMPPNVVFLSRLLQNQSLETILVCIAVFST